MPVLTVPRQFSTIAAAVAAAGPCDTIRIAADYAGDETVTICVDGLIVDATAATAEVGLVLGRGVTAIMLSGTVEINLSARKGARDITGNAGSIFLRGNGGSDAIDCGRSRQQRLRPRRRDDSDRRGDIEHGQRPR